MATTTGKQQKRSIGIMQMLRNLLEAETGGQLLRFGISGATTTLAYLVLTVVMIRRFPDFPLAINIFAYTVCLLFSFLLQKHFTFRGDDAVHRELPKFVFTAFVGLGLSSITVATGTRLGLDPIVCFLAVALVVAPLSYVLLDRFVFRSKRKTRES
jgi:putative flippase GtrA